MSLVRKKGKVVPPNEYISPRQFKDVRRPGQVDTTQDARHGAHPAAGRLLLLRQEHHPAGHWRGAEALRQPEQEPAALPLALAQVDLLQLGGQQQQQHLGAPRLHPLPGRPGGAAQGRRGQDPPRHQG